MDTSDAPSEFVPARGGLKLPPISRAVLGTLDVIWGVLRRGNPHLSGEQSAAELSRLFDVSMCMETTLSARDLAGHVRSASPGTIITSEN